MYTIAIIIADTILRKAACVRFGPALLASGGSIMNLVTNRMLTPQQQCLLSFNVLIFPKLTVDQATFINIFAAFHHRASDVDIQWLDFPAYGIASKNENAN